jgi:hypothetical protein
MKGWFPLAAAGALYVWQCHEYLLKGDQPMALVFLGYAIANVGFIWSFVRAYGT